MLSKTGILQEMKALPKSPPAEQEPNRRVGSCFSPFEVRRAEEAAFGANGTEIL
jgi:hypothetical protein